MLKILAASLLNPVSLPPLSYRDLFPVSLVLPPVLTLLEHLALMIIPKTLLASRYQRLPLPSPVPTMTLPIAPPMMEVPLITSGFDRKDKGYESEK